MYFDETYDVVVAGFGLGGGIAEYSVTGRIAGGNVAKLSAWDRTA